MINDVLHGKILFNNLPPIKPRIIRLYLCAPFKDTINEQNELYENVFPKLREFSMYRYNLEFQVINFHWGIDEKQINNKFLLKYCLNEINRSKNDSIGPTFLAILGDTYGEPILPLKIERVSFENIIKYLNEQKVDTKLLQNSYRINKNYLLNQYELRNDIQINAESEKTLIDLLKLGHKIATEKGAIVDVQLNTLDETILNKLLDNGAFNNKDKINKIFSFVRISKVDSFDIKNSSEIDKIKEININKDIPSEQIYRIRAIFNDSPADQLRYKEYLKNFGENYLKLFKKLIDKFVQQHPEYSYANGYEDALYHYHYISSNISEDLIAGGERAIKLMRDYIHDTTYRQPLFLIGPMASGKTSCLATFASTLHLQLLASMVKKHDKDAIIVRFIGADRKSMDVRSLLKSICLQLKAIYDKDNENNKIPDKFSELKYYFKSFLTKNSSNDSDNENEPRLIILLDSLQDLYENDLAHKLDWLPSYLRANCKLILSISTESVELVERVKSKYTNSKSYVFLNYVSSDQADSLIRKYLSTNKYRLEDNQLKIVKDFIENSKILSLHLKLFSSEFLTWKSYTPIEQTIAHSTLNEAIMHLFTSLEKTHGYHLVKYLLCYITLSRTGLSEMELQDILSLDDLLLSELKSNLKQPNNILIVPFFYILPLIQDLQKHLIIRPDNGLYVIYWRHKLFAHLVFQRYISSQNPSFEVNLHKNISEYYMGKWAETNLKSLDFEDFDQDEFKSFSQSQLLFHTPAKKKFTAQTNRLVPKQPLQYDTFHTHIKPRFNLRKLVMLPYHLIKAGMIDQLLTDIYFNIEWLYYKICAFDLQSLLHDFELYKDNSEVNLVRDALKLSEPAILENKNHLFIEITGRLLPYYDVYERIRDLIHQCDQMALKFNPIVPIRQISKAPSWILQEQFSLGLQMTDNLQLDLLENHFYGRILVAKNLNTNMAKFFDLDLMEPKNDVLVGSGMVYCSKNGKYACTIEESEKLIIKRIETGDFYNEVKFNYCEIGQVLLSNKYAAIVVRKAPSPILIDLDSAKIVKVLPYQASFTCISPDEQMMLVYSEDKLNYHKLPELNRVMCMDSREIPELAVFGKSNSKVFTLSRRTKQVTYYNVMLEKRHYKQTPIMQDTDIYDMKLSHDESLLLICSLYCLYVINARHDTCDLLYRFKPVIPSLSEFKFDDGSSTCSVLTTPTSTAPSLAYSKASKPKNQFNGFGITTNNKIIFATYYTYLFCWDVSTGKLLRVFQSTLSANRIIKSYSSNQSDSLVSLLDDGNLICWNLMNADKNIDFEDMALYGNPVIDCLLPKVDFNAKNNSNMALSYSKGSPDAKLHNLKDKFSIKSVVCSYYDEKIDNPLSAKIDSIQVDESGRFCFLVIDMDEFYGKRIPEDLGFIKKVGSLIDLNNETIIMEKFSYIVRKNSRFQIQAKFLTKAPGEIYLLLQITSCINDFDPYLENELDWAEFETNVKFFGPIKYKRDDVESERLVLFDEFKLFGELLNRKVCVTNKTFIYCALTHECHKMTDSNDSNDIKAKRYDTHLNLYELFENKKENTPVQLFDLNEFLNSDECSHKNILIDIQTIYDGKLLVVYSKDGATLAKDVHNTSNKYEYDYSRYEFIRDIKTPKGAILYDPKDNVVLKRFSTIFTPETNVCKLVMSDNNYILDDTWSIYDVTNAKVLYCLAKYSDIYSYKWTRFLLNGRYFITTNKDQNKLYVIRCYDSKIVTSLWLHDKVSCLTVGEADRTIVVGTVHGYILPFKLLIDLEAIEATETYLKYFRFHKFVDHLNNSELNTTLTESNLNATYSAQSATMDSRLTDGENEDRFNSLSYDLKRMLNSAYEHKRLKSRESNTRSRSSSVVSMQMTSNPQNLFENQHSGIIKNNLTNLATGIKYAQINESSSRACCIQ